MGVGYYIFVGFVILVGLAGSFSLFMKNSSENSLNDKKDLLKKMKKNGDIDSVTYVKYLDELEK